MNLLDRWISILAPEWYLRRQRARQQLEDARAQRHTTPSTPASQRRSWIRRWDDDERPQSFPAGRAPADGNWYRVE